MIMEDRRKAEAKLQALLHKLTLSQEFRLIEAAHFGFQLAFIRDTGEGKVAMVRQDEKYITVSESGDVDYQPDVNIRPK